jgi:hypothetical protein
MAAKPMTRNSFTQTVDHWTRQAVVAGAYLMGLYRALDDGRQAALAAQALGHCEERARRLGLQVSITAFQAEFLAGRTGDLAGEQ